MRRHKTAQNGTNVTTAQMTQTAQKDVIGKKQPETEKTWGKQQIEIDQLSMAALFCAFVSIVPMDGAVCVPDFVSFVPFMPFVPFVSKLVPFVLLVSFALFLRISH